MTTEGRVRELCTINNQIVVECDKIMQYLQMIKEKSAFAVTYLYTLNTANFLRRYSATYEYLNKFHIKLLDQNCLFELFFLELNEPIANDDFSIHHSVRDLSAESANFDPCKNLFSEIQEPHNYVLTHAMSLKQSISKPNAVTSNISGFIRTSTKKKPSLGSENSMNIHAKEFHPKSSTSSRDVVVESSSISSESNVVVPSKMAVKHVNSTDIENTAEKPKSFNVLSEENVAQHNSQSSKNLSFMINEERNQSQVKEHPHKNHSKTEVNSTSLNDSSTILEPATVAVTDIQEQKEETPVSEKEDLIDFKIKDLIHNMNEKIRQSDLRSSVPIPDLRPTVVRKNTETNSSTAPSVASCKSSLKNSNTVHRRKSTVNTALANDSIHLNITVNKCSSPKEGELCFISSIDSPSSFYIHTLRDDNTLIDFLSQQISEISHSLRSFHTKEDARKFIKKYCVCYINAHNAWCRVEITNWMMEHDQMLEVKLIDYGLICKVPLRNIREASQYFFVLPAMAAKCELAWAKPLNNQAEWSSESIAYFTKLIQDTDRLFTVCYVEEIGDRLIIDLQNHEIQSVAGLMISDGKAVDDNESDGSRNSNTEFNNFMKKQIVKSQGIEDEGRIHAGADKLESLLFDEEDDEEVSDPNLAVSHYNPKDEREICRIFLAKGYCPKKTCSFSHEPLNPDGWTTDREAVYYDTFNHLHLPPSGTEITVKIVSIVDLRTFYVVIKNLPECTNLIGLPTYNIRSLVKLMNDPEEVKSYKPLHVIAGLGEIILVKYENNWQRGRVVGIEEYAHKVELEILLVDFGFIEKFNMKNCRKIQEKHLHLPFQVVLCTLCNATMKNNLTEKENEMGCDYLEMNVENKKLKAKVMHSLFSISVHLFTESGQDIGEELIKAGIVDRCSESFTARSEHGLID